MIVVFDEDVPEQAVELLRRVLRTHTVYHVDSLVRRGTAWKGKKDQQLLPDLVRIRCDVFVTKDHGQLSDPDELRLIKRAGFHHVRFHQDAGVKGYARAAASVVAAMPAVMEELAGVGGQRLVRILKLDANARRHETIDPRTDPPAYW